MIDVGQQKDIRILQKPRRLLPLLQALGRDVQASLWTSLRQVATGHRDEESISRSRRNSSHVSEIYAL